MDDSKVDLSGFDSFNKDFDPETGHEVKDFNHEPLTPAQLNEALDNFVVVLHNFIQDFNMVMDQMGARVSSLETTVAKQSHIMHMLARRSDWFMEGNQELAKKERLLMKEEAEKIKEAQAEYAKQASEV